MNSQSRFKLSILLLPILLLLALTAAQTLGRQPRGSEAPGGPKKRAASNDLFPAGQAAQASETKAQAEFKELLSEYQEAASYYFSNTKDAKARRALLDFMNVNLRSFTIEAQKITGLGCKAGRVQCQDGSCVNKASKCKSSKI